MQEQLPTLSWSDQIQTTAKGRAATKVINQLTRAGYQALLAGGSVRDLLMGTKPKDYDIATSATPDDIEAIFPKTIPVGRQFGILVVRQGGFQFEVATFRTETGYSDQRRPDAVAWATVEDDAVRRDFTINALYLDIATNTILDFVGGRADIDARVLRFVGNPDDRVREDLLRVLRAVRFKNALDLQYDLATYQAVKRHARDVTQVSGERLRDELDRMWQNKNRADTLVELAELGLLAAVLPEIEALRGVPQPLQYHQEGDVFDHTVAALRSLPARTPTFLVWAALCHDAGKAVTLSYPSVPGERIRFDGHKTAGARLSRQIGVRLRMPRYELETIAWLVDHHMSLVGIDKLREAKRRAYLLDPRFKWLIELHRADATGTIPRDLSLYRELKAFYAKYLELSKHEQKQGRPKRLVTGDDLQIELGLVPGKKLGQLLAKIDEAQLERQIHTRAEALDLARRLASR